MFSVLIDVFVYLLKSKGFDTIPLVLFSKDTQIYTKRSVKGKVPLNITFRMTYSI